MSQIRSSGKRRVERAPLELADPFSAWHYLLTAGFSIQDDESILTINKGLKGLPPLPARVQWVFSAARPTSSTTLWRLSRQSICSRSSSENRLRSESRILSGSGGVEARTLSGQRRAALCRTNVTAFQEMVKGRVYEVKPATPRSAGPTKLSDLTVFPKAH